VTATDDDGTEARREEALLMRDGVLDAARLVTLLADSDWRVRKQAALAASARLAEPVVTELLVDALLQPDDVGLRNAAVEAFAHADVADAERVATALTRALARAPATSRKFVAAALVGAAAAGVPTLAELARVEDVMTASAAVEALAALSRRGADGSAVGQVLVGVLARSEPVLRLAAMDALLAWGTVVPSGALGSVLADPITSPSAVRLLGRARDEESFALLLGMLPQPRVTFEAALSLAARSGPTLPGPERLDAEARERLGVAVRALDGEPLVSLASGLASASPDPALSIARMLLEAGELRLLPRIVELGARTELDPPSRSALVALRARAIAPLLTIVRSLAISDARSAAWALEAASELTALEFAARELADGSEVAAAGTVEELRTLAHALLDQEELARRAAESVLARWEPARSGPASSSPGTADGLRRVLASDDAARRAAALDGLVAVDTPDRVEIVSLALTDEDERVQLAALRALGRTRGSEEAATAARAARVALGSELASLRAEAISTLSSLGAWDSDEHIAELLALVADPSPRVAIAALRGVGLAGLSRAVDPHGRAIDAALDRALLHVDPEVVKEGILGIEHGASDSALARARRMLDHEHWSVRVRAAEVLGRASTRTGAREALAARRALETDTLVLRTIDAGLTDPAGDATGGEGA